MLQYTFKKNRSPGYLLTFSRQRPERMAFIQDLQKAKPIGFYVSTYISSHVGSIKGITRRDYPMILKMPSLLTVRKENNFRYNISP